MAEDDARLGGSTALVHVEVRATDSGSGNLDNDIVGVLKVRQGDAADRDLEGAVVVERLHAVALCLCLGLRHAGCVCVVVWRAGQKRGRRRGESNEE